MLSGKGFEHVYNLSGGIKAWKEEVAYGNEDHALELFSGDESPEKVLAVAYSLEEGLREFYLSMTQSVKNEEAIKLFKMLADIEIKHQQRLLDFHNTLTDKNVSRQEFEKTIVADTVEGGLTTSEFMALYKPDWNSVTDVTGLAMSIEAQALDLYQRASERSTDKASREFLGQIAAEEKNHMKMLGDFIDNN